MKAAILIVVSSIFSTAAVADVMQFMADRDTVLFSEADAQLSNGIGPHLFIGRIRSGQRRRSLLAFDLTAIPPGSAIVNARLVVTQSRTVSPTLNVSLHRVVGGWGESGSDSGSPGGQGAPAAAGDATWQHRVFPDQIWTQEGGDFVAEPSAQTRFFADGEYSFEDAALTRDIQRFVVDPASNQGWIIVGNESSGSGTARRLESRESPRQELRPVLEVSFNPPRAVPAGSILGLALLALATGLVGKRAYDRLR